MRADASISNDSSRWVKKPVSKQQIEPLCNLFNLTPLQASVFVRRGITEGKELLYYLEDDLRFQHNPFLFSGMEDAVERILQAKEEGEKVLIYGDSDVDGVTSTAILYEELVRQGIDVQWRLPLEDDGYGLSIKAIDDFAAQDGTLIITVDCGISNNDEIAHANDLGIEVIVTDHHNPPEELPEAIIILDPKLEDSLYPFDGISGAAVAYKLVSALRFADTDFYNAEISLLQLSEDTQNQCYNVDCIKIKNLVKIKELHEKIVPGQTTIYDLKLPYFLQGQLIYSWDSRQTLNLLGQIFGSGIEFNLNDLRSEISNVIPSVRNKTSAQIKALSQIAKYSEGDASELESIYNLYVTYCKKVIAAKKPEQTLNEQKDLQLVALAAMADIMPMKNENRIFVKAGIASIKKNRPRQGLAELFNKLNINLDSLSSTDLSWNVIPAMNAAGRMGHPEISLKLLISSEAREREQLAATIHDMNEERKDMVSNSFYKIHDAAQQSIALHNNKLCVSVDESINKGVTGILASRLMQDFNVPTITITYENEVCTGSMRSCRGFIATSFLDNLGDIFINHGGHNFAAGFSFYKSNLEVFLKRVQENSAAVSLEEENTCIDVDAEIPEEHLTPENFCLIDMFEPCGAESPELVLMTRGIKLIDTMVLGKKEPRHLKLIFDTGKYKIPAMFWGQAERLRKDILIGKKYDVLYNMSRNYYNGTKSNQLIIKEIVPSTGD
ncbi:exonuclease RecJ [Treponema bryantii]|uniref:Single-stranded-DNA-specific exonuclease RecJ n=1 Tax=Treponema bryantii TaxID=163 RepID=A0A1H9I8N5_9SPIR|nr:single-stranded-DNA-specific exonuclease RecJ [Treponema bryantii]SEQ71091.1 exonuclease RecJ [Treponema bryantii]